MKFTYQLVPAESSKLPAFFPAHPAGALLTRQQINRTELNRAVAQLKAGADVHVVGVTDSLAATLLVFELTFYTMHLQKTVHGLKRTVPGHLFIRLLDTEFSQKIW